MSAFLFGCDDPDGAPAVPSERASTTKPAKCPSGTFPDAWNHGASCANEPAIQIHAYDKDTFILRQSLCTSFEAPFLYLLFGNDKVLLEDTGAGGIALRKAVDDIISQWLEDNGKSSIQLVVVNSHSHGDHVAGNSLFVNRPDTTIVGLGVNALKSFFGIASWPTDVATFELGDRTLDIVPIPGHQGADIAIYDRRTGILTTGDTLYPGRLFINTFSDYQKSIERLVQFTKTTKKRPVCAILGAHIEMTSTPGIDFAFGSTIHPDEHPLPLARKHLLELNTALKKMINAPKREAHDDFVIFPLN